MLLWFDLLHHRGKFARTLATAYCTYVRSVCHVSFSLLYLHVFSLPCQLQLAVHTSVQSVMSDTKPRQKKNFLLMGQQGIVVPLFERCYIVGIRPIVAVLALSVCGRPIVSWETSTKHGQI